VSSAYAKVFGKWLSQSSANRRRVGGGTHLSEGKKMVEGRRYFRPLSPFIGGGERGGLGAPLGSVTYAGVEPEWATGSARRSPLLQVADVWAAVGI
jgi:hypothetical protein